MPIYVEGFEAGDITYYENKGWDWNGDIDSATPHQTLAGEGGSYYLETNDSVTGPALPSSDGRWFHFYIRPIGTGPFNTGPRFDFQEPGTGSTNASVIFESAGGIEIRRGTSTVVASSTDYINTAVGHWIAIEMHADNSGQASVWVDGVEKVTFSGDLQSQSTSGWNRVDITGGNTFVIIDDIIVTTEEEGRLEECYVLPSAPDGDGTTALTPSTGSTNWELVDEIPPSTTDYNEATATAEDFYTMANLGFTPGRIVCYSLSSYVDRDGTITTGQQGVLSGATTDRKTAVTLGASGTYETIQAIWETDPNTSTAIAAVDTGNDTVSIAGDVTGTIEDGSFIEITGSTGNDGIYVVESTTFSSPNTVITVTGDITDATADGNLTYNWTATTVNAVETGIKFA